MTPESLAKEVSTLVSLPDILHRLDQTISDPRASFEDVAKVISDDTGLTARLLKVVNSPFYGFPSTIDTISRALTMVGTKQLRDLAFATTVMDIFEGVDSVSINMKNFWCHSIGCGIAAKVIATNLRMSNVERFFLMGMLHDVGRLVIFAKIPDKAELCIDMAANENMLLVHCERHLLGFDHAQVGKSLLHEWKLPLSQQEVVGYHHTPIKAFRYPSEAAIVHLADVIANALELGSSGEVLVPELSEKAWELIGMNVEELPLVFDHIEQEYEELSELFLYS